jgi:hypothetical protein
MAGYVTRGVRMLSGCLLETMTTDQLTPQQKAVSGLIPGYFDSHGWGFGVSIVTRNQPSRARGYLRVVRRLGYFVERRPEKRFGRHPVDAACLDFTAPTRCCQDFKMLVYGALDD